MSERCICGAFQGWHYVLVGDGGYGGGIPYCNKCGFGGYTREIDPYPIYWGPKFRKIYTEQVLRDGFFGDFEFYWDDGNDWFWKGHEAEGWALFETIEILRELGFQ